MARDEMSSGAMRKRMVLQAETTVTDHAGGYVLGWADIATVWARLTPVSGQKLLIAQHLEGHVTHHAEMRYIAGVTIDMRLSMDARTFNIRSILNVGENNQWLDLLVQEGSAT